MTALTRGRLPARVYWRRRVLLLLVLVGLVAGAVRLAGPGSGEPEARPQASRVAAEPAASEAPEATAPAIPSEARSNEPRQERKKRAEDNTNKRDRGPVLAEPEGVCSDRDVAVTPTVRSAVAGAPVTVTLELRTASTPACTWHVSPSTLTVKITSGADDIWSSQECPRAIPSEDVVVRNNVGTEVEVTWSGRRSDDECSRLTEWALPGWYYVAAAALAGEPSDLHFELEKPEPRVEEREVRKQRDRDRASGRDERRREGEGRRERRDRQGSR